MMLWSVLVVAGLCLLWALQRWLRVRRYWAQRGVPHEAPHPLLGSMAPLFTENPAVYFRKYYERFRGSPYVGIWLLWQPALIVNCPELARRVLVTDFDVFCNRNLEISKSDPIGHYNMFVANEPQWSSIRKKMSNLFTSAKLKVFQSLLISKTKELVERIKTDVECGTEIDLRNLYSDYSTDVLSEVLFGISSEAALGGHSALRDITHQFMQFNYFRFVVWRCVFFLPKISLFFRLPYFPRASADSFRRFYKAATTIRTHNDAISPVIQFDMIDLLMKLKQANPDISEDMLMAQAAILVDAGNDTIGSFMSFCTYELAFNPHVQEKLRAELVQAKQSVGNAELTEADLTELVYFDCVIKETLRKYSSLQWLDRVATRDYVVDDKLTIAAGTTVYVNAVGMAYDPDNYPDPHGFHPERFLPGNHTADPYTYMPFGEGPRHCIAKRLGLQVLRLGLSAVVLNYRLLPRPGDLQPGDHTYNHGTIFLSPNFLSVHFVTIH